MVIVMNPERTAAGLVAAALRDDTHHPSRALTVFRRNLVRDQPKLGDGIWIVEALVFPIELHAVDVLPVDHEVVGSDSPAVHRENDGRVGHDRRVLASLEQVHAGNGKRQLVYIVVGPQRQLGDPALIVIRSHFRVCRVQEGRIFPNRDLVGDRGQAQLDS